MSELSSEPCPPAWPKVAGLAFGGDYNPEQWPEETWADDVALMREAGVSMVTVGVFSWAMLERGEGKFDFGWLDRVFDLLHEGGIAIDLATATASPPPWFSRAHQDSLPVTREGTRLWPGSRQAYCPSSPDYRKAATGLAHALAVRYGKHPALVMWHVNNEYGCHVPACYCDISAAAFRAWLTAKYGDVEALNSAWGTAFWSQRYTDLAEVLPPRATPTWPNPTQQLDWQRFCSDELLACFLAERDAIREITPDIPVTTNFMGAFKPLDYFAWAEHEDVVSNDHYLIGEDPASHVHLAMSADLVRSTGGGAPWVLMEHSTSAVNWQPRNLAKQSGQLARDSLRHVARGADAVCFFQWRASRAGAEKFHSGMVPHAGVDTKVWHEVVELGKHLKTLGEIAGTRVQADVAIAFDWQAWWAVELDSHPSSDVRYLPLVRDFYQAFWNLGVTVDFARPDHDLSAYKLVVMPALYLVTDAAAENIAQYVHGGGRLVCTFFSGIVDENDAIRGADATSEASIAAKRGAEQRSSGNVSAGYPGAFHDLLGVRVEEFFPLRQGEVVTLSDGATGRVWTEMLHPDGAEVTATYTDGPLPGWPATTSHRVGSGTASYLTSWLDAAALETLLRRACADADVRAPIIAAAGVEAVRRRGADASYLFVVNHTGDNAEVEADGVELLTGRAIAGRLSVPPGGFAVVRERIEASPDTSGQE